MIVTNKNSEITRDKMFEKLIVLIATYNELENLKELHRRLREVLPDYVRIYIIDDNSPDGTGQLAEELSKEDVNLRIVHRKEKKGLGAALIHGYQVALEDGAELICTLDADLSHNPKAVPGLVEHCLKSNSDVTIGTRWIKGGGMINIKLSRLLISKLGNALSQHFLGIPYQDCNSNFRCYHKKALLYLAPIMTSFSKRYSFLLEVLFHIYYAGGRITEYPIVFVCRQRGKTKVDFSEMFFALLNIICLSVKMILYKWFRIYPGVFQKKDDEKKFFEKNN